MATRPQACFNGRPPGGWSAPENQALLLELRKPKEVDEDTPMSVKEERKTYVEVESDKLRRQLAESKALCAVIEKDLCDQRKKYERTIARLRKDHATLLHHERQRFEERYRQLRETFLPFAPPEPEASEDRVA